uniref:MedDCM-OCT-S38-C185-cds3 n=1 Tax=Candidatus Actinomarina minuta TaxID=1389454 RepID=S5DX24_9ACTN|nr:MedDCM-OCT-S38-C185-cds3 [Candidatus Actinomarina minuta]
MVNYNMKNKFVIFLVVVLFSACSSSDDSQGVISTKDLSTQTTVITIVEEAVEEIISPEDAQLLLARCLRESGYDVQDPKNDQGLRSVLTPIFIAADEKGRTELFETIQICAEENNIPLGDNSDFENPEAVADRLDTELEFAQCLRGKGIEVEDPSAERPLRPILVGLVQSGQYLEDQVREAAGECFDDLGLEPPQQGGG